MLVGNLSKETVGLEKRIVFSWKILANRFLGSFSCVLLELNL